MFLLAGDALTFAVAFTSHFGMSGEYNEVHPHIRYTRNHFIAGAYLNSESRVSPYVGVRGESGRAFAEIGAVGNYSHAAVVPYIRVGFAITDQVSIFAAPAYEAPNTVGAVIGFEISF